MLNALEDLDKLLIGTELENSNKVALEVCEGSECSFAIKVNVENALRARNILRALLDQTQRYPLLVGSGTFVSEAWAQNLADEDLFSRWEFTYEYSDCSKEDINLAPQAIVERAKTIDIIQEIQRIPHKESYFSLEEAIDIELRATFTRFGVAPQKETILNALLESPYNTRFAVEKYIFDWELEHLDSEIALAPPDLRYLYLDWYPITEPINMDYNLILLPTPHSWESPAYIHWFEAGVTNKSETIIALLQSWSKRFNAELVAHDGMNLLFNVHHRPTTPEEAFQLAVEQDFFSRNFEASIRDHARALLYVNQWCLNANH
jgi:hypothetical protein